MAVPPPIFSVVADSTTSLLIQEIVRYSAKRCGGDREELQHLLEDIGYPIGFRVVERLSLTNRLRFTEKREILKFICKDLWNFLFRKQADRLQTNQKGDFVIFENSLPWLKDFTGVSTSSVGPSTLTSSELKRISGPDATLWKNPSFYVFFICEIIRGALSHLGLSCTVTGDVSAAPACSFSVVISSSL
ncbi:transport protein particle (trapp) component, bet3 protein [Cardiosporidium cionae]|uniref:Transport protein particle (Trapp) component, bet3 protein n=1 Tax=Cardiosporidium cionae TaxID=476202 RepID=A0ABQ7J408_9APIC|nr:transport protein particle (trapp) component, bet3 protein [Cardiosporidium cionae]|eukprot:KAF8817820.1 transport protein particle (trapp) component, bet3 protein [Cardiosporidium cionae]